MALSWYKVFLKTIDISLERINQNNRKQEFCAIQIWYEKSWYDCYKLSMARDKQSIQSTTTESFCMLWSRGNRKNMSNYTFCIIIINGPKADKHFHVIASNNTKTCFEVIFVIYESFVVFVFAISRTKRFLKVTSIIIFR